MAVPIYPSLGSLSATGTGASASTYTRPRERRWKVLIISPEILLNILSKGMKIPFRIISGSIPEDAKIVKLEYVDQDFSTLRSISPEIRIAIESKEFPLHVEGQDYEIIQPIVEQVNYIEFEQEAKDILKRLSSKNYG